MVKLSSWGRLSHHPHQLSTLQDRTQAITALVNKVGSSPGICLGMGRSYGDICLNPGGTVWQTQRLDRLIQFDESTGQLRCEAGVLLGEIQRVFSSRGWMLPVTPGTQLVTVGGAIANDVHGKNHHRMGSFGHHVIGFTLARTDGSIVKCKRDGDGPSAGLFQATIGGMGLTGVILDVELQLRRVHSPCLHTETLSYQSLADFFALAADSQAGWEYTVSWIDCLSGHKPRGIFMRANHAPRDSTDLSRSKRWKPMIPFTPPFSLVNKFTLRPFNALYYASQRRKRTERAEHYQSFFYPLDNVGHWNRIYGPRGFYQYQCVIPDASSRESITAMLKTITDSRQGSFLAVLKTFGDKPSPGLLSFPMAGATLALDFPNQGSVTLSLFNKLDQIVKESGGRLYPAKDARMPADLFALGYPRLKDFLKWRDPGISSAMSRRLLGK